MFPDIAARDYRCLIMLDVADDLTQPRPIMQGDKALEILRQVTIEDEALIEGGKSVSPQIKKVAAIVVITNPFARRYVEDLSDMIDLGGQLGALLVERILKIINPQDVESYGKGCIVGAAGELEHSAALIHPKFGAPIRAAIGGGNAIIPSTKKVGSPGTCIDVPLSYKDKIGVSSHLDAMEVGLSNAPNADEILVALAMSTGGRPHARIPGSTKEEVEVGRGKR